MRPSQDELDELRALWLSRLMFGFLLDAKHGTDRYTETRTFEQFLADHGVAE